MVIISTNDKEIKITGEKGTEDKELVAKAKTIETMTMKDLIEDDLKIITEGIEKIFKMTIIDKTVVKVTKIKEVIEETIGSTVIRNSIMIKIMIIMMTIIEGNKEEEVVVVEVEVEVVEAVVVEVEVEAIIDVKEEAIDNNKAVTMTSKIEDKTIINKTEEETRDNTTKRIMMSIEEMLKIIKGNKERIIKDNKENKLEEEVEVEDKEEAEVIIKIIKTTDFYE